VGLLFWHSPVLLPLKLLAVVLHEAGHAAATYLVGGHVTRIAIDRYQGGVAHCVYPAGWWRTVLVASGGYVGSTVFGVILLRLAVRPPPSRAPRAVLWILGVGLVALALLFFRDAFSWAFALPTAAVLVAAAWKLPADPVRPGAIFLSAFACLYALFNLRDDVLRMPWETRKPGVTDADLLAEVLPLPALFWAILWTGVSVLLVAVCLRGALWTTPRKVAKK
jgi:hypothetical protein